MKKSKVDIIIPKGYMGLKTYQTFADLGFTNDELFERLKRGDTKKRYFDDGKEANFLLASSMDVPDYLNDGSADIAIMGQDVKEEYEFANRTLTGALAGRAFTSLEVADKKKFPNMKFSIIGRPNQSGEYRERIEGNKNLVVSTSYPETFGAWFEVAYPEYVKKRLDIISKKGGCELDPALGRADIAFDIVETGTAVEANGLEVYQDAYKIPTLVAANRRSLVKDERVLELMQKISGVKDI